MANRLAAALTYTPQTSRCPKCKQDKPLTEFSPKGVWCRLCVAANQRGGRQRYPAAYRRADAAWRQRHPEKALAGRMRRQALMSKGGKQLGRAEWRFLVSLAQGVCLCCGEGGKLVADHIIPVAAGGRNEIGNRQPLCGQCNARKGVGRTDYRSDYFRARVDQYIRTS